MKNKNLKHTFSRAVSIVLSLAVLTTSGAVQSAVGKADTTAKEPVIYYDFHEESGSVIHNVGTAGETFGATINDAKNVTWTNEAVKGRGAALHNGGYFTVNQNAPLKNLTDFTLSMWVNLEKQSNWQTICTFGRGQDAYLIVTPQRGSDENGVSVVMSTNGNRNGAEQRISYTQQKEKLSCNTWHYIAFTLNKNVGTLYVDGEAVATKDDFTINPSMLGDTTDNYIGKSTYPDPNLEGGIDEFKIYDYALSAEQINTEAKIMADSWITEDMNSIKLNDSYETDQTVWDSFALPFAAKNGSTIQWSVNDKNYEEPVYTVIRGKAGEADQKVTLKADFSKLGIHKTKEYHLTIPSIDKGAQDKDIFAIGVGNPTVPAYLADTTVYYDEQTERFMAFGTNDGNGAANVYPTQMWYSTDCKNWHNTLVDFPNGWAGALSDAGLGSIDDAVWAPSFVYNPDTQYYYLSYSLHMKTFVAKVSLEDMKKFMNGTIDCIPWSDANGYMSNQMLVPEYDAQLFIDEDAEGHHTMYLCYSVYNGSKGGYDLDLVKFKADATTGNLSVDNSDPEHFERTYDGNYTRFSGAYRYHTFGGLRNEFEGSFIYKDKTTGFYYLMWSVDASETYNVRYAVSKDGITGQYKEMNHSFDEPILSTNATSNILGPGHHSVFDYKGQAYIAYHRQHYPFVDSKRQTCINKMDFVTDVNAKDYGAIKKVIPTNEGVDMGITNEKAGMTNLAVGKQTRTSSVRGYDINGMHIPNCNSTDISFAFAGNYAVDENNATHWDAGVGVSRPWIIVDLGYDCNIDSIETTFEFTSRTYKYTYEYLEESKAKDLDHASLSKEWTTYVDKKEDGAPMSPVVDKKTSGAKARYVKLTIEEAVGLPRTACDKDAANATNGISVLEMKVYGTPSLKEANDLNRTLEAESYWENYGLVTSCDENGAFGMKAEKNNSFLKIEGVNLSDGSDQVTLKTLNDANSTGIVELYLDSLSNTPIATFEITKETYNATSGLLTQKLNKAVANGKHDLYVLFKDNATSKVSLGLNWIKFGEIKPDTAVLYSLLSQGDNLSGRYQESTLKRVEAQMQAARKLLESNNYTQKQIDSTTVALREALKGLHKVGIRADYYTLDNHGGNREDLYDGELEDGNFVKTATDEDINHSSMETLLGLNAGTSDFAGVRWTGCIVPKESGDYTFETYSDNGIRVYLDQNGDGKIEDKENIIDWWSCGWEENHSSEAIALEAGKSYSFMVEYIELSGGSIAKLSWKRDNGSMEPVPADVLFMPKVDYTQADTLLKQCQTIKASDYTKESYAAFEEKLMQLKEYRSDTQLLAEDLQKVVTATQEAMKALVKDTTKVTNPSPSPVKTDNLPKLKEKFVTGGIQYAVTKAHKTKGSVCVVAMKTKTKKTVTIPDTVKYKGYRFKVTAIKAKAFNKCSKTKTITVKAKGITKVEKNAFKGTNKKATLKLPKSCKKKYGKLFKGKGCKKIKWY
ncbi:MAG: discoidin domain-containing protein [Lachnospiraceae bacterium]|nr:discoidin domain-containing protein [Lachnospiraceae bacterium]